jgi:hypothetical protein
MSTRANHAMLANTHTHLIIEHDIQRHDVSKRREIYFAAAAVCAEAWDVWGINNFVKNQCEIVGLYSIQYFSIMTTLIGCSHTENYVT